MAEPTQEDLLANLYGFYAARARGTPGWKVAEEGGLLLLDSGLPVADLNIAFVTGPVADPAAAVRRAQEVVGHGNPWRFECAVDAAGRFADPLRSVGLTDVEVRPGFVLRPDDLEEGPRPDGWEVREAVSLDDRRAFYETLMRGMTGRVPPTTIPWDRLTLEDGHLFVGWHRGRPVASAILYLHRHVAGLYGVATVEEARRQGLGRAISAHAVQEGFRHGARLGFLQSTPMGLHVYRAVGFRPAFDHQVWRPGPAGA